MPKIFGIPVLTFSGRLAYAVVSGAILLLLYTIIPQTIYSSLGRIPSLLGGASFFDYALLISVLSGFQIVFRGKWLGDAAAIGNGVSQIAYLFLVTDAGVLTVNLGNQGLGITIDFRTILYLLMLPSALLIVSTVVGSAARASTQKFEDAEQLIMT